MCLTGIKTFPDSNCGTFSSTTTARIKVTFIVCLCQTLLVLTRRGSLSVESSRAIPIIYLPCKNPSFYFGEPTRGGEVVCFFLPCSAEEVLPRPHASRCPKKQCISTQREKLRFFRTLGASIRRAMRIASSLQTAADS